MVAFLNRSALDEGLEEIRQAPQDNGVLEMIVARPAVDERTVLAEGRLTAAEGLEGDNWNQRGRSPKPECQITLMNVRMVRLLDPDRTRWPLAGDQLFVDLDLSDDNLPPGQQLQIGDAVLEITSVPHNGCPKFAARFGEDALEYVNSPVGKQLHLRGIYARVVQEGAIRQGDRITKIR